MTAYKVLSENGKPYHGGHGVWPLPNGRPGDWLEVTGKIIPCKRGLHLCRRADLIYWLGPVIYEAEFEGDVVKAADKIVVARARLVRRFETWNDTTARLFAADCAKYAVRVCEKAGIPVDDRVKESIQVVYRYARGEATDVERSAAEWAAHSAYSAAYSAAHSAYSATYSAAYSAAYSAYSATYSAADSAAHSAYSAAYSAARSAAYSAYSATYSATYSADSAAHSAVCSWQTRRLFEYLNGKRT